MQPSFRCIERIVGGVERHESRAQFHDWALLDSDHDLRYRRLFCRYCVAWLMIDTEKNEVEFHLLDERRKRGD